MNIKEKAAKWEQLVERRRYGAMLTNQKLTKEQRSKAARKSWKKRKANKLICDDSTTHITIATPKGWKCSRKGCSVDYVHYHTTYEGLSKSI